MKVQSSKFKVQSIMKLKNYIYGIALGAVSLTVASCYNADRTFQDYQEGTTAYFAYQNPVRTLILGSDIYDNELDNAHKCRIWATMGGAYGGRDATVDVYVDEKLCDNLYFMDVNGNVAEPVRPMPGNYYDLIADKNGEYKIPYNGDPRGYIEVQFTDAFFADTNSVKNTYVIPLVMKNAQGIDHVLTGTPREGLDPSRTNTEDWDVLAKDYVLYCVKYINPWDAKYIRRGVDKIQDGDMSSEIVRKDFSLVNTDTERYKENPVNANDEVCSIETKNMTQAIFPVSFRVSGGSIYCNLVLTFNGDNCTISTDDKGVTVTGSGEYIKNGTDNPEYKDYQWGNMNGKPVSRDILRLNYNVNFEDKNIQIATTDTMVVQTRESNQKVFFSTKYVK